MRQLYIIILLIGFFTNGSAQKVGIGTNTPNSSARMEVASATQGFLPPRLTIEQRDSIVNPATGLTIYCIQCGQLQVFSEGKWKNITRGEVCDNFISCNQIWMTKNLDVDHYRNGDSIPEVTSQAVWDTITTGAWCYYNNNPSLGKVYGKLYNNFAVRDPRGLAPEGWHVSTYDEWRHLYHCLGSQASIFGGQLKEKGTIHWQSPNTLATNFSGFSAIPGGQRFGLNYGFDKLGTYGYFASTPTPLKPHGSNFFLWNTSSATSEYTLDNPGEKNRGVSVRCIKNYADTTLIVGDYYQGGFVIYVLQPGDPNYDPHKQHGLIVAVGSLSGVAAWSNGSLFSTGATSTNLGFGQINTNTIVAAQGAGVYAANRCFEYVDIYEGYSDWYLPNKDELNLLYIAKTNNKIFISDNYYWSSSEFDSNKAWGQSMQSGMQILETKSNSTQIRPIRSF